MTTRAELDERYGRTRPRAARLGLIAAAVVGALLVGWFGWSTWASASGSVDYDDLGFDVADSASVSVTFQVTSTQDRPVACVVEALDEQFGVVGWRVVEYPPADQVTASHTEQVRTTAEATTGYVSRCWLR